MTDVEPSNASNPTGRCLIFCYL